MDVVTMLATLAFYVFVFLTAIKIVIAVWGLKDREERMIEQNERQLNLLEKIAKAIIEPNGESKDRD